MEGNGSQDIIRINKNRTCLGIGSDYGGYEIDYSPTNKLFGRKFRMCNNACRMASCVQCRQVLILEELEQIFDDASTSNLEYLYVNMDYNRYVPMSAIIKIPAMIELGASTLDLLQAGEQCRMLEMDPTFTKFRMIQCSKYSEEPHNPPHWDQALSDQLLRETFEPVPRTQSYNVNFVIDIERLNVALVSTARASAQTTYQGNRE